jgi:energy-coupling factor transport system permease protein
MKLPWAWVVWLVVVLVILSITRNPFYLVIVFLCVLFTGLTLHRGGNDTRLPVSPWKFAAWIIVLATLFNALTSHYGETVLFTIPGQVPLVSGKVTLEALAYGATNGLILTAMLAAFTVLNLALPVRDLVSLIPRAFFPVAVVTSIAVTYLPTTARQFKQIREAQMVRGHQMRTLRDWLPLFMPLLVGGLEHAMQLAEAMTARGFGSSSAETGSRQALSRIAMLLGVALLAAGWILQLVASARYGWAVILLGGVLVLYGLWSLGRQAPRTAYRRQVWGWQDIVGIIGSIVVASAGLFPLPGVERETLYYQPYPVLMLPGFDPLLGIFLLGLLVPGLLALKVSHQKRV